MKKIRIEKKISEQIVHLSSSLSRRIRGGSREKGVVAWQIGVTAPPLPLCPDVFLSGARFMQDLQFLIGRRLHKPRELYGRRVY